MSPIIEIKNLSKTFNTKNGTFNALKNINLTIEAGNIYGIIGMSGAGKSTLVRCMNYLEKPTDGSVYIEGRDLKSLTNTQLRKQRQDIAMIFQNFNLLMQRNVLRNVCFPLEIAGVNKKEAVDRAIELLEIVGLTDKAKSYPAQLSGGQKQRVAIARALATNPKILLCDEATSALDPKTTKSILKLLKDINNKFNITIVIITHEMEVIEEICTHVAIIDEGNLVEKGKVFEVFTKPQTQAAKKLVYKDDSVTFNADNQRKIRIIFEGNSSFEPVIADMILNCKARINIFGADTKNIEGKAYGQMILQLPEDVIQAEKVLYYLKNKNITVEELNNDDITGIN